MLKVKYMLPQRLRKLRKENKKTQEDMAKLLGITRPAYTAYETGKRHPDYDSLEKIADFFNCTIDYLLGRTDNLVGIVNEDGAETDVYEQFLNNDETLTFKGVPIDDDKKRKKILKLIELELEEDIEKWEQKKK